MDTTWRAGLQNKSSASTIAGRLLPCKISLFTESVEIWTVKTEYVDDHSFLVSVVAIQRRHLGDVDKLSSVSL